MRLLVRGLLGCVLAAGVEAQYEGYPPYPAYYPPYANPSVTVIYGPPPPPPSETRVIIREYPQPRPIRYLIAFKDSVIHAADAYWVNGNTLYYITRDHQQMTAPLDSVDRPLSERLNSEQNVVFYLPSLSAKAELRRVLEQQFNLILDTRNTSRGLVVRISDVFFGFNQYTLTPTAREKLAKIAGILIAYSRLCPHLEGYTDNVGSAEYNLQLSRKRADAVRDFLISQGVAAADVTAKGFGEADPVTSNATPAGRQQNRRVEMVIPADVIGVAAVAD